ncbi:MAG: LLM class flavin-dependent oxidoreductase [Dehalococcoidia bacterium]
MKFGLSLSGLLQHSGDGDMVQRFKDVLRIVEEARELGFDFIYTGHHYLSHPYQTLQPLVSLGRLAAVTGDMEMVSTILLPMQNPVQLAEDVATLDVITNGRIIISAALGYRDEEYEAFGVTKGDRVARMLENLELVKQLWSGEEVTFHGQFTRVTGVHVGVKPIQKPHPRIWMAANGDRMVRRIAEMGHPWYLNPHAPFDTLARQVEMYKDTWAMQGHGPIHTLPMARETFVGATRQEAFAAAAPYLGPKYATYAQWGQDKALPGDEDFNIPLEELTQGRFIIGGPEDCIQDLQRFKDIGVTHVATRMGWPGMPKELVLEAMRLGAKEVFPALR